MSLDQRLAQVAEAAIRDHVFPGCVVGYIREGHTQVRPFGHLTYEATEPVQADTYYDVASVTKSIPTNCLILKLIEDGRLRLEDKVVRYIPELDNTYREDIQLKHLLTYTMVLDLAKGPSAQVQEGLDAPGLWQLLFTSPLKAAPGRLYLYSNAPAVLLGLIAERVGGKPVDELAQEWFFDPLGMERTTFHPEKLARDHVAPTEHDWRGQVHGQVHDEMAWVLRRDGYVAGHAGLFTTAGDLLTFAQMLLAEGEYQGRRYFRPETVRAMYTNQIAALGATTGLGWELGQRRFMGRAASDQTFGKTGFTGSIILIDPVKSAAMVLLSNRIYPQRSATRDAINQVRCQMADIVFA